MQPLTVEWQQQQNQMASHYWHQLDSDKAGAPLLWPCHSQSSLTIENRQIRAHSKQLSVSSAVREKFRLFDEY